MACQCGCASPAPPPDSGAEPERDEKRDLERRLEELDRRVKELEAAA